MKKVLFAVLAALLLVSCKDDEENGGLIVDWNPIEVKFYVADYGLRTNYVSLNYNDMIYTTTLTYRGKTYSVEKSLTKDYMPTFKGLHVDSSAINQPYFCFGELDGADNYDDDFIITFADGSTDTIHFKRVHKRDLNVEDSWTLNGKKRDGDYIILYRQKQEDGSLVNLHLDWE